MKQFLLFSGDTYYPYGGWEDFRGSFDSVEFAIEAAANLKDYRDWWHIVDTSTTEIVKHSSM